MRLWHTGLYGSLLFALWNAIKSRRCICQLSRRLQRAQAELEHERDKCQAERAGRIRQEQELRRVLLLKANPQADPVAEPNLPKVLSNDRKGMKAKIKVPRLNGARMGVLATRSPHRPVPIGLSTAQIIGVEGNTLILGGADIVDGSPVLDVKPYVPFCDGLMGATAPAWVTDEAEDEPLRMSEVRLSPEVAQQIRLSWQSLNHRSLYTTADEFIDLITQVLSRDIRSLRGRLNLGFMQDDPDEGPVASSEENGTDGVYHVVLEGLDILYDIDAAGAVDVRGAAFRPDHYDSSSLANAWRRKPRQ